jgi:hypothetical protein
MKRINWKENLQMAKDIAKGAGMECKVKLEDGMLHFDEWMTISNEERSTVKETVFGMRRTMEPTYVIEAIKTTSNYPHEPDDVDVVEIGDCPRIEDAIFKALINIFTNRLNNIVESVCMERYYRKEQRASIK